MKGILEICVDSAASAIAAQDGGADRIELCSALAIGGISPSPALFRQVKENTALEVRVLLRPRAGDFCYDEYEFRQLREEVEMFRKLGADGTLNVEQMKELVRLAGTMKVTMHRAFDVCSNPMETMETCIQLGIDTILTSGQKSSAMEGWKLLAELTERAAGRIEILAGAGITPEVIRQLYSMTGITSYHMSGKKVQDSRMEFRREGVPMGIQGLDDLADRWAAGQESGGGAEGTVNSQPLHKR